MLSGLCVPSGGDALLNGESIISNMDAVHAFLGICPQHDVIFPTLTVLEHLEIFASVKGRNSTQADQIQQLLRSLGLVAKTHYPAGQLSGGQQRKLSVAIALVGGKNAVVILDEPTSGMDPVARREVWTVLESYKRGRSIVFTTHFMDEADLLGDRIAIMHRGRLQCAGSSLFLKSRFGLGYLLTIELPGGADANTAQRLVKIVEQHIPGSSVVSCAAGELSVRLPKSRDSSFPTLFLKLEELKQTPPLGRPALVSYGISCTTLEEVFLRLSQEGQCVQSLEELGLSSVERMETLASFKNDVPIPKVKMQTAGSFDKPPSISEDELSRLVQTPIDDEQFRTCRQQTKALFCKRWLLFSRNWESSLVQMMLPWAVFLGCLALLQAFQPSASSPAPVVTAFTFADTHVIFEDNSAETTAPLTLDDLFIGTGTMPSVIPHHPLLLDPRPP
jgi:ABC-type multidrug transport system ATPase subunit